MYYHMSACLLGTGMGIDPGTSSLAASLCCWLSVLRLVTFVTFAKKRGICNSYIGILSSAQPSGESPVPFLIIVVDVAG